MIYIIEAKTETKSMFKIGTTGTCPWARLSQMQTGSPLSLKLVGALIGNKGDERMFHDVFKPFKLRGEWYSDCKGIRELINDFPIQQWEDIDHALKTEEMEFEEAYRLLTLLRHEPLEIGTELARIKVEQNLLNQED